MKKFWRGFRKESDLHERKEIAKVRSELIEKLRELVRTGGHEGEAEFVSVLKQINRDIRDEELREKD